MMQRIRQGAVLGLLALLPVASASAQDVAVEYYHLDALGSVRAVTDQSGALVRPHAYFPFGEGGDTTAGQDPVRFTGKERDAESGLDYFGARYYASRSGRFTTVDPGHVGGNIFDPQSWNAYAYARNNPLKYVDPTGTEYEVNLKNGSTLYLTNDEFYRLSENPGAGIAFDGFWDVGDVWIGNGATRYGSYRYYYGFSDAIRDAGNSAAARIKENVTDMAVGAAAAVPGFAIGLGLKSLMALRGGDAVSESATLMTQAAMTVGNKGAVATSKAVALEAAEAWAGVGARAIRSRSGEVVGKISADGQRVYRITSVNKAQPYINLDSKASGGNLHIRW